MSAFAARSRLGSRINNFKAGSAFTRVTACLFARPPAAAPCIEGFGNFVTSTAAPIATGRSDRCRGGIAPPEDSRLVTAHKGDIVLFLLPATPPRSIRRTRPRTARASRGGYAYHALHRGNARRTVFHKDGDDAAFRKLLGRAGERTDMRLLAYCLRQGRRDGV